MLLQAAVAGAIAAVGYMLYKRAPKKGFVVPEYYDQQVSTDFAPSKVGIPPPTPRRFMSVSEGGLGQSLSDVKTLHTTADIPKLYSPYAGDKISIIGQRFGMNPDHIISFNTSRNPNNPAALTFGGKIIMLPYNVIDGGSRPGAMGVIRQPGD